MSKKNKADKKKKADKRKKANKQKKPAKKKVVEKTDDSQTSVIGEQDEKIDNNKTGADKTDKRDDSAKRVGSDNIREILAAAKDAKGNFDLENSSALNREQKRVNVDFPQWMIVGLDDEAQRLGINRQAVIKTWIAERLDAKFS